ncbi:MAG: VWA domain-containing protein [Gemmatimonadetes bacterium]|nr:VWA domain-containing protein [Gemmatimonadota bacterium]
MRFSRPELLWLLIPALVLLPTFFALAFRAADRARRRLVAEELVPKLVRGFSRSRRRTKAILQTTALLLVLFALAGPRVGSREITVKRRGIDLIVAIDTSRSMLAQDIKPSRLLKARREVAALLDRLDGDRVGLVAFAGDAFLQCPLTIDYGAARMFLDVLDVNSVSRPGTNVGAAIRTSLAAFGEGESKHQALILVTDGEDLSGDALDAAEEAARRGIRIFTVGVGSEAGEPIPDPESGSFHKDRKGEIVMSRLDAETLERIALETGGQFHRASMGELELDRIWDELSRLEERDVASRAFTAWEERFQIPLGIAVLLLLLDFALPERVRTRREWEGRFA